MSSRQKQSAQLPIVLHSRHQWLRWRGTLIVGIIGLGATLLALWLVPASWHAPEHGHWMAELWGGGLFLTAIAAVLSSRFAPESLLVTARRLDGRFAGKGRLEAVALLKDSTSPLAIAQREETARYLAQQTQARAVRALPWLTGSFVLLVLAHLLMLALWLAPTFFPHASVAAQTAPAPSPTATPQSPAPESSIAWKTPEQAIQANPAEDVPATATVNSTTGLKNLTLDVSVNGQVVKSIPLPSDSADTPGEHEIKVSIPLDEVKAQPFDVVSYDLHGQSTSENAPNEVTSPVQFVEVRPFHGSSTAQNAPDSTVGDTPRCQAYALLNQLELAELHSISDNFALTHDDLPSSDPAHAAETKRVGQEQADLSKQADEIAKTLNDDHLPAAAVNPVHQAEPLMDDSGKKILAAQNSDAATSQEKALSLISQAEKAVYQTPSTSTAANNPSDSFENEPPHVLTPRQQTLLGQLETLEKNQTHLAEEMDQATGDATNTAQPVTTIVPPPAPPPPPMTNAPVANAPPGNAPQPPPVPQPFAPSQVNQTSQTTPSSQPPQQSQASQSSPPPQQSQASQSSPPSPTLSPSSQPSQPPQTAQTPAPQAPAPSATPPIDPFGPDADKGSFAERQENVLKGIDTLQSDNKISPGPSSDALASAKKEAADSLHQLGAEQESAAREPAATAAVDLQATIKALNQEGQAETRQALAETQQKLNDMASQLRGLAQAHPADTPSQLMSVAQEVHAVQQGLQSAADHQENAGSAQGADQLNRLASQVQEKKVAPDLAAMSKGNFDANQTSAQADALESLATQAASALAPAQPSAQNYADLAGALQRSEADLAHLADEASQSGSSDSSSTGTIANSTGTTPGTPTGQMSGSQPSQSPPGSQGQQANAQPSQQTGSSPGQQTSSPPVQQPGSQTSQQASSQPNPSPGPQPGQPQTETPPGSNPTQTQNTDANTSAAFHDALQDLKNQIQQTAPVVPSADAAAVDNMIVKYDKDTSYRPVKGVDVVRFHTDLQQPLEKLILDVQALQDHAQREEIVKAPDLDETPAIYRPAVSKYFEDLSHDYHSPAPPDSSKP